MTLRIGWFTTARGPGSRAMFEAVRDAIEAGAMDAELAFVFCNRERGEAAATDSFLDLVEQAGAPLVARSSVRYRRAVGGSLSRPGEPLPAWRLEYDRLVDQDLEAHPFDIGMLAGYMLILEREFVARHAVLNLHPALPDGPVGMWQAVIRELIRSGAEESGVMLHLAIAEVDEGPRVAYCRYPLRDPDLDPLLAVAAGTGERCARASPPRPPSSTTPPSTPPSCSPRSAPAGSPAKPRSSSPPSPSSPPAASASTAPPSSTPPARRRSRRT